MGRFLQAIGSAGDPSGVTSGRSDGGGEKQTLAREGDDRCRGGRSSWGFPSRSAPLRRATAPGRRWPCARRSPPSLAASARPAAAAAAIAMRARAAPGTGCTGGVLPLPPGKALLRDSPPGSGSSAALHAAARCLRSVVCVLWLPFCRLGCSFAQSCFVRALCREQCLVLVRPVFVGVEVRKRSKGSRAGRSL